VENQQGFFSRKLRAGKRRTYFFDVRSTKQGDYFVTITESKRRFDRPGYDSHKIFLYKEDFTKFAEALGETITHIKTELNPDFDYDAYDRETYQAQLDENGGDENQNDDRQRGDRDKRENAGPKEHTAPKEQKKPTRPNKDLMSSNPILEKKPSKSILGEDAKKDEPTSDEAMEW
jgi:hypothetical protein